MAEIKYLRVGWNSQTKRKGVYGITMNNCTIIIDKYFIELKRIPIISFKK